ncbi:MAG TPA: outer membrane lipoprotein-sorting protein [Candidatus Binatia bacterium]|nr:outer membrane lipoprotein-sorting protein [Candidatus Binatia bacterium]
MRVATIRRPKWSALLVTCAAVCSSTIVRADDSAARDLVQRTLEALPQVSFTARIKLTGDARSDRELMVKHKIVDGARNTYLEAVAPDYVVGVRFLLKERVGEPPVQYMRYIATHVPVLIGNKMRAERFLGSNFYLADVVQPDLNAFTYAFVGDEKIDGRACKLVESVPKDPTNEVYGKVIHAVDPKDLIVVRRRFFDKQGQAIKEWTADKVEKISGYWTVRDQRMKDLTGTLESHIQITEINYGAEIPDSDFTKEYLGR